MFCKRFGYKRGRGVTLILIALFFAGCAHEIPLTESVRFVVFGNTAPVSPFSGFTQSLDTVISAIESEKPAIVIHTGDAVYGGTETDGIRERDITRQFTIFFSKLKNFHSVYYTIPGDRDLYNGTPAIYTEYSGRGRWYSFNYGSMHFIALDTSGSDEKFIDDTQMEWLKKDLKCSKNSNAVFVIIHRPFITTRKKTPVSPVPDDLHKLFMQYNVKAVFSGSDKSFYSSLHDSIRYISAGCAGFIDKRENRRTSQYYVVTFMNNNLDIRPGKIIIP